MSTTAHARPDSERSSQSSIADDWSRHAGALAAFTIENLVNRHDAFGHYLAVERRGDSVNTAITDKKPLTLAVLERHYRGESTGDIVGLHSTVRDEPEASDEVGSCWSRWVAWDIDRHHEATDPEMTRRAALTLRDRLLDLGFPALLLDSNGNGGYHLWVIFEQPIPTEKAFAFGRWIIRDWGALGLDEEPEVFPKQPAIVVGGFGNWLRLPGRHHTRDHFTRVWSGDGWLDGHRAIKAIFSTGEASSELIPAEALVPPAPPARPKGKPRLQDYEKDAALAIEALDYLDPSMSYLEWIRIGMALSQLGRDGLNIWDRWSSASEKYREGFCDRMWKSFTRSGVNLGTLFQMAKERGFEFPKSTRPERNGHVPKPQPAITPPADPPESSSQVVANPEPIRPQIEVNTERHEVVRQSIVALAADPDLFRRGSMLVTVIREMKDVRSLTKNTSLAKLCGSPRIDELSDSVVGLRLSKFIEYYQVRKDQHGEEFTVPAHPPEWCIKGVATSKHWPSIRRLSAVAECPYPRSDGSIVELPGYDLDTETLYLPAIDFPEVPQNPTRQDARDAWSRIFHHYRLFPYDSDDDRVVVLAGILTVIARPAIASPVPGIAVNGNKPSTGKGKLIDGMSIPGTGRSAPTSNYPDDPKEAAKVKVAIALSGDQVVHFDNKDAGSFYGNSALDSMLTASSINDRILGTSKRTGEIPLRTCWFLSGNNIAPGADAYRRWLACNLISDLEEPETRADTKDEPFPKVIVDNRGQIVRDALTILRAHALAGYPNDGWGPMGSFEDWDRIIRGAVWFATDRDCLATQRKIAKESPDRLAKIALLEAWCQLPGGKSGEGGVTSSEALQLVDENPERFGALHAVLLQKGRAGKLPTSGALGNILRGLKNNLTDGLRLTEVCKRHGAACWVVESLRDNGPEAPSSDPVEVVRVETFEDDDWTNTNGVWGAPS